MRKIAILAIILILTSCTFSDVNQAEKTEKEHLPTLILENASYTIGQRGQNPIRLQSDKVTFHSDDNNALLDNFSFEQLDEEGNVDLKGNAKKGEMNTSTRIIKLEGNVRLISISQEMEIEADKITFDSANEEIFADGRVVIKSKDGNFSGIGFKGDLREQRYAFDTLEKGMIDN